MENLAGPISILRKLRVSSKLHLESKSGGLTVQLISLESMTCEASTQRTHLTILAEVWHGFDTPGHILIMIAS